MVRDKNLFFMFYAVGPPNALLDSKYSCLDAEYWCTTTYFSRTFPFNSRREYSWKLSSKHILINSQKQLGEIDAGNYNKSNNFSFLDTDNADENWICYAIKYFTLSSSRPRLMIMCCQRALDIHIHYAFAYLLACIIKGSDRHLSGYGVGRIYYSAVKKVIIPSWITPKKSWPHSLINIGHPLNYWTYNIRTFRICRRRISIFTIALRHRGHRNVCLGG